MEQLPGENLETKAIFTLPTIESERGEIERVAQTFSSQNQEEFVRIFKEKAQEAELVNLTEDMWSVLENTDSFDIAHDDWEQVAEHVNHTNRETGADRSWEDLRLKIEQGLELEAPIVLKHSGRLHLVSGNTRLMVARALGKLPKILLVEM